MRNKQMYSTDTLEILKNEINKVKEKRKNVLSLDKVLLQQQKDVLELIKSGCNAKEITNMFKAAQIKVGIAKIKQLYFAKKISKPKSHKNLVTTPISNNTN